LPTMTMRLTTQELSDPAHLPSPSVTARQAGMRGLQVLAHGHQRDGRGRWMHFASRSFIISSVDSGIAHALGPVERGKPAAFCFNRCSKILLRGSPATPNRWSAWLGFIALRLQRPSNPSQRADSRQGNQNVDAIRCGNLPEHRTNS
jgi:hypothetical protein